MKKLKSLILKNKISSGAIAVGIIVMGYFGLDYYHQAYAEKMVAQNAKEAVKKANAVMGSSWDLHLDSSTDEDTIIQIMHEMSHQKVEADEKWGTAIPMIPNTINQVYKIVDSTHAADYFSHRDALLEILDRWKQGDFSHAAQVHNELWELEDGNVGQATGNATPEEEAEYILANFPNNVK